MAGIRVRPCMHEDYSWMKKLACRECRDMHPGEGQRVPSFFFCL